jgi:hypothetical protein
MTTARIACLAALLTVAGFAWGIISFVDSRYAKCAEVKAVERRLDLKVEGDVLNQKQDRLWKLQDRFGTDPTKIPDQDIRQQYKELETGVQYQREKVRQLESIK